MGALAPVWLDNGLPNCSAFLFERYHQCELACLCNFLCWLRRLVIAASKNFNFGSQVTSLRKTSRCCLVLLPFILSAPLPHKMPNKLYNTKLKTPEIVHTLSPLCYFRRPITEMFCIFYYSGKFSFFYQKSY